MNLNSIEKASNQLVADSFSYEGVAVRIKAWAIRSGSLK